ncbi:hypothetical protein OH77DRAFT_1365948, partial [Trametes cingulata]
MSGAPWDIYAEQLTHLGYGYPLWVPDPAPGTSPIEIGDVGWIKDGEFVPLFNALRGENESQPMNAVPVDHVPLDIRRLSIRGPRDRISQPILCSRSVRTLEVSGASSGSSCGFNFNFECADDAGALLLLSPAGRAEDILSRRHILDYVEANFDRWMEFANSQQGLGLKEEQILFVSGTMKTSRWGVAAFKGKVRTKQGAVVGNLGTIAEVDFSLSITDAQLSTTHSKGPPGRP